MLFLELAAQSVKGFSPSIRLALKPGYVALKSPTESCAPLAGLIAAVSYPDGRGGDAAYLAPGAKSGRAGLTIQGHDGTLWRIVRDLGGAGGLHRFDKATNQFEVVTQDAIEMSQTLRSSAGFPPRSTWEQLFSLAGAQLPTRRPKGPAKGAGAAAGKGGGLPRMAQTQWNMDGSSNVPSNPEDAAKLPALEAELATAKRAAEVQFKLDGVNSELFELESKTKEWEAVGERLKAARAELNNAASAVQGLPEDILVRARRYPDERKRHDEQIARIHEEQQSIVDNAPQPPEPLRKDQRFLATVGLGAVLYIAATFTPEGSLRYLALLAMLPFTFAALLALRFIEDLQRVGRQGGKSEVLTGREKKLTDEFALTTMIVQKAFTQVGASNLEEFLAVMGRREGLQQQVQQLELQHADVLGDPEYTSLSRKVANLKSTQETLNQELVGMSGGYVRDARDIEREIARIKDPPPPPPPPKKPAEGIAPVSTAPAETWDDPTPHLMVLAADLFASDIPTVWTILQERVVQYLTALTDRRYHGMSVDKDGHAKLDAPGRTVSAKELPGKDLDLAYLAVRLTIVEKASAQHKVPLVVEDTVSSVLDEAKQALFGRMIKHLGSLTQVLHVGASGESAALADAPAAL